MRTIEIDASGWSIALDFLQALREAIGAPHWHGMSLDAFLDTTVWSDEINGLKPPYTIVIQNAASAPAEVQSEISLFASYINELAKSEVGTAREVRMQVSS